MIIFKPCCGLGNQMFLYAAARSLAARHDTELFVDKSYYVGLRESELPEGAVPRAYELDVFNIKAREISGYEGKVLRRVRSRSFLKKMRAILPCVLLNSLGPKRHFVYYAEKGPQFDRSVLKLPDNVLLEGYFMSYKYFNHCGDVIRDEFSFREPPDADNEKMTKDISSVDSVSLHIRRGDYITNKAALDKLGPCNLGYYKRAADYVAKIVTSPHFFIFSDDPEWVGNNFKIDYPMVYVTHNVGDRDYEDLRLMSCCKHNIIANSSFSWWGAWLNTNSDKLVIAPTPAFDKLEIREDDFYPKDWELLPKS